MLWLAAALGAIAFSLANSVRGETERTATAIDGMRSYYLATGAIERAVLYMEWGGYALPDTPQKYYAPNTPVLNYEFPTGHATVEVIPEGSKLNINYATAEELYRLLTALGAEPERAHDIALGIEDWRKPAPNGPTEFDQFYLSLNPSFPSRHASFEEIEEVLLIKGMTPELFYGTYTRNAEGRLVPRGGLRDCITVYSSGAAIDINTAEPAVLAAIGVPLDAIQAIVARRRVMPFRTMDDVNALGLGDAARRLRIGGSTIFTLRSTAQLRLADGKLSDMRRTVAAMIKRLAGGYDSTYHVMRWYDTAWAQ